MELKQLCELQGVSGREELVRAAIYEACPRVLVSKRVKVGYAVPTRDGKPAQEPLSGVIGAMAIHQQTAEDRKRVLPIDQLYVDIGAKDKDEALEKAPAGTPITFDTAFTPFGEGRILARALDDRIGCYNMLRLPGGGRLPRRGGRGLPPDAGYRAGAGGDHRQRHGRYARRASRMPRGSGHDGQLHG